MQILYMMSNFHKTKQNIGNDGYIVIKSGSVVSE